MTTITEKLESLMKTKEFNNYINSLKLKSKIKKSQLDRFYNICL